MPDDTRCAVCGGPLTDADAEEALDGATLRYHADFRACVRQTFAQPARATALMRACVGMDEAREGEGEP